VGSSRIEPTLLKRRLHRSTRPRSLKSSKKAMTSKSYIPKGCRKTVDRSTMLRFLADTSFRSYYSARGVSFKVCGRTFATMTNRDGSDFQLSEHKLENLELNESDNVTSDRPPGLTNTAWGQQKLVAPLVSGARLCH
jgi:hypothetical protein